VRSAAPPGTGRTQMSQVLLCPSAVQATREPSGENAGCWTESGNLVIRTQRERSGGRAGPSHHTSSANASSPAPAKAGALDFGL
jgi:hypothetical protein